jgi:rRNA-processing protein FCF1
MILIDSNALVVLLIGLIDPKLVGHHKRSSIYDKEDFYDLLSVIGNFEQLVVLPNVWTEVDNLLNNFTGDHKYQYIAHLRHTIQLTTEKYIESLSASRSASFFELGLTDSIILDYAKECKLLITSDSKLSDYALASGIRVYDMVKAKNDRIE